MHTDTTHPKEETFKPTVIFRNDLFGGLEPQSKRKLTGLPTKPAGSAKLKKRRDKEHHSGGNTDREVRALRRIEGDVPIINLHAEDRGQLLGELLVVLSWRDSIIEIPRALIPDSTGAFKLFGLNDRGEANKPVTVHAPTTEARLHPHHMGDRKVDLQGSRWALLRVHPRTKKEPLGSFQFFFINIPRDKHVKFISRKLLVPGPRYFSPPAFELTPEDWFYTGIMKRMGVFMKRGSPVPFNNLTRYYQYMSMSPQGFIDMYNLPEGDDTLPTMWETVYGSDKGEPNPVSSGQLTTLAEDAASIASSVPSLGEEVFGPDKECAPRPKGRLNLF
jgi:hypothetical protein